jgi:hypothetical protein
MNSSRLTACPGPSRSANKARYRKPPYVGGRGWVGIELAAINDDELTHHIHIAWRLIAPKKVRALLS